MTDLTAGCTRTGPHPATRTELEARAEGHTPSPWTIRKCMVDGTMTMLDGPRDVIGTFHTADDTAFAALACNSYDALKEDNERLRGELTELRKALVKRLTYSDEGDHYCDYCSSARPHQLDGYHNTDCVITMIDSALSLSRGCTDKKEGA